MVTVPELYSQELPELPRLGPGLSAADAEVALSFLAAESISATSRGGGLSGRGGGAGKRGGSSVLQEKPPLGPSGDVVPFSREQLEAKHEAVKDARERTCEHLRLALQRRAASRLSTRSTSCDPTRCHSSATDDSFIPAAFPFPEPIPHGPPERSAAGSRQSTARGPSPFSSRFSAGPSAGCSSSRSASSRSRAAGGALDGGADAYIPAVFPFPEPIPHGPPSATSREHSKNPFHQSRPASRCAPLTDIDSKAPSSLDGPRSSSRLAGPLSARHQTSSTFGASEGRSYFCKKEEVAEDEFVKANRQRANDWISQCAPKTWLMEHERPYFVRMKLDEERRRKRWELMYYNMPTMPFDVWCDMKKGDELGWTPAGDGPWRASRRAEGRPRADTSLSERSSHSARSRAPTDA